MRTVPLVPSLHLFVCANRRAADDPLGGGCGDAGDAVFDALKAEVARRGAYRAVWVTRTHCLGICPKRGATVAVYPRQAILTEIEATDAPSLFDRALQAVAS
jgi:(2Fe-2S) ferredoxin